MHLVMLQAMLPAPFEILPILVGDAEPARGRGGAAPRLGRARDGHRGFLRPVAFPRPRKRGNDRRRHRPPDRDARRTIARRAAGPAASCRSRARSHIAAERDMRASGLHLATSADVGRGRRRGSSATAPSPSNMPPRRGSPRPIASFCFRPAWPRSARRRGTAGKRARAELRTPTVAGAFVVAGDLRHADRERPAARLHRLARAATAADRGCDRQHRAGGLRRPALPASERERSRRAASRRVDPLPSASGPGRRAKRILPARSSPTATASFSASDGAARLFLPSVWRQLPDARAFVRHLMPRPASKRLAGRRGWRRRASASNRSARRGDGRSGRDRASRKRGREKRECPRLH